MKLPGTRPADGQRRIYRSVAARIAAVVAVLVALLYPLLVYVGLNKLEPRQLALLLAALLLARLLWGRATRPALAGPVDGKRNPQALVAGALLLAMFSYTLGTNDADGLKLYPVIISFSLLLGFAHSLLHPPSAIERLARLTSPNLPPAGVLYTRKVTFVWCGFFLCNGCIALYTSLFASMQTWTLYNGVISYLLIGCLLGGEYLYRLFVVKA